MVDATTAPPERLYRPDISLIEWRRLVEEGSPFAAARGDLSATLPGGAQRT